MDTHRPVLLQEAVSALRPRAHGRYVDATYGRGGHARALAAHLGPEAVLVLIDRDPDAIAHARQVFGDDPRCCIHHGNFSALGELLATHHPGMQFDGILLDLGVSSPQFDQPERGFSFMRDGRLDMRMNPTTGTSAAQWIAEVSEQELSRVLARLGEERFHRRVARAIVRARAVGAIDTTAKLAAIVSDALPVHEAGRHPATRSFQAIRMHVNDELGALARCLPQCEEVLAPGGRLCVISFHSLEDRLVKRFMRDAARVDPALKDLPQVPAQAEPRLRLCGRAVRASEAETAANPRARSARLRVAERLP